MIQQRCIEGLLSCRTVNIGSGNLSQPLISSSVEYLHYGENKAEGREQRAEGNDNCLSELDIRGKTLHQPCGWRRRCWQLALAIVVGIGGAVALLGNRAFAQQPRNIEADDTLGAGENSVVENLGLIDRITGGARRGQNLFHSFLEFNVALDRGAYFLSPDAAIENILARVTGGNPSEILGTLGTFEIVGGAIAPSNANLFLINPNGIIFGEDSKLDVGGSFVATTANAVGLGDTGRFSASEPDSSNLLNINPDAFFFNRLSNQAEIVNRSTATTPVLGGFINDELPLLSGLQVIEGKSLLLLGGDVSLDGGVLRAPGGRVELGGLSEAGTVELNADGNNPSLSFPDDVTRADVSLTNGAEIVTIAGGDGSIAINAQTVDILGGSSLFTGIATGNRSVDNTAGDIEINATDTITISESSFILNVVLGIGDAGDIEITTGSLEVTNGAQLSSSTSREGNAGNVKITATDTVRFDGASSTGSPSVAVSFVEPGAVGDGGDIEITAGSLEVTNGAGLVSGTLGEGDAGNVKITATGTVRFDGVSRSSAAFSSVGAGAVGDGGDIEITAGSLEVTNGAQLSSSTSGEGDAGNVKITATDTVRFDGVGTNGLLSLANSSVRAGAVGDGGDIEITAGSLEVTNGARLFAETEGEGNAGNVKITATDTVRFDGVGTNGRSSAAFSSVEAGAVGDGGNIEITAGSLEVTNSAQLSSSTFGEGNAGRVKITATDTVRFDGVGSNGRSSAAFSIVGAGAVGDGDDIEITAGSLEVTNGAVLSSSTFGEGNAGGVKITATDTVRFDGASSTRFSSAAFSIVRAGAVGDGDDIEITAGSLEVTNGARLSSSTLGEGDAGNVKITATDTVRFDGVSSNGSPSFAASTVEAGAVGDGGDIEITAGYLEVTNGAQLSSSTSGEGDAGNVKITATDTVRFDGASSTGSPSVAFSTVEAGAVGDGGDIEITAGSLEVTNGAALASSTLGEGDAGNVKITATDTVRFDGVRRTGGPSAAFSTLEAGAVGDGGDIEITAGSLEVTNGAVLSSSTFGEGNAGGVKISATDTVRFDGVGSNGENSGVASVVAPRAVGEGGVIQISTGSLSLNDALLSSQSLGTGTAGDITINTRQNLETNRSTINTTTLSGDGGDITLQVGDLLLMRDNSNISTTAGVAGAGGDGGDITINADFVVGVPRENSDITANAFNGKGGNITITTQGIFGLQFRDRLTPLSDITASSEFGLDGEFILNLLFPIDVTQGLSELPTEPVTSELNQSCQAGGSQSAGSFINTGRGGLPPDPTEPLGSNDIWEDVQLPTATSKDAAYIPTTPSGQIIEAQGWIVNETGHIELVAQLPATTSQWGCSLR